MTAQPWPAPRVHTPLDAMVPVPGSKSISNRALILAALADGPSQITGLLRSRDTDLMMDAVAALGAAVRVDADDPTSVTVSPGPLRGGSVDCGLAGTVMRFVPPLAALASGVVQIDGDEQARKRPMKTTVDALRALGVRVDGDGLPLTIHGAGEVPGGELQLDASSSSQFVSGLLLSAPRFAHGLTLSHVGSTLPSLPHIDMTVDMLRTAGVAVANPAPETWTVAPGPIAAVDWAVEADLSNAAAFLAAAAAVGGRVTVPRWPSHTTQPGAQMAEVLTAMGCTATLSDAGMAVHASGTLYGVDLDLRDIGELTPTIAALCALAQSPSVLSGIGHLRGHETDRLHALRAEITRLGGGCSETADGLVITPAPLHGGVWHAYADHRMATAGAIIGLAVDGVEVDDIATTAKTMPDFPTMWARMLNGDVS